MMYVSLISGVYREMHTFVYAPPPSVSTFNFVSHNLSTAEWQHAFMHLCDGSIRNVIYPILSDFQFQQSKSSTDCHLFGSGPSVLFIDAESSYYFSRRVFCTRMFIYVPTLQMYTLDGKSSVNHKNVANKKVPLTFWFC